MRFGGSVALIVLPLLLMSVPAKAACEQYIADRAKFDDCIKREYPPPPARRALPDQAGGWQVDHKADLMEDLWRITYSGEATNSRDRVVIKCDARNGLAMTFYPSRFVMQPGLGKVIVKFGGAAPQTLFARAYGNFGTDSVVILDPKIIGHDVFGASLLRVRFLGMSSNTDDVFDTQNAPLDGAKKACPSAFSQ
jgi:hypothetical protein